jgi:hypothetical protein
MTNMFPVCHYNRRPALDVRRCVPEPFYMGPMSRPAAERRIDGSFQQ